MLAYWQLLQFQLPLASFYRVLHVDLHKFHMQHVAKEATRVESGRRL